MSWFNETVFYHIYPLGLLGCEKENNYLNVSHRLNNLIPWVSHIKDLGCNGVYIGPLFKSVGHGYETTDYKQLDNRLGTNDDLKIFVEECHKNNMKVIFDAVFNHTGRDFFAFKDILENRENSRYLYWYNNVNFYNNNSYNDGFSYDNWAGYDLLVKLNLKNEEVVNYLLDVMKYWIDEFDIDGLRLDAADVMDINFLKTLRYRTSEYKRDFWLMGEVYSGDYSRWVSNDILHSVTNMPLQKSLYSGMNDHNFFEIAHTVNRYLNTCGNSLYNLMDNHDLSRIVSSLNNKTHFLAVSAMLYTLPGNLGIYYGTEFGLEGKKIRNQSDDNLRPYIDLNDYQDNSNNPYYQIISVLGNLRKNNPILSYGDYKQIELQTTYYSYARSLDNHNIFVCVSNTDENHVFYFDSDKTYKSIFTDKRFIPVDNKICVELAGNKAEVLVEQDFDINSININDIQIVSNADIIKEEIKPFDNYVQSNKSYEEMSIEELQNEILNKMSKNGPVTDYMLKTVRENVYHDSLINWVKSFH